MNRREFLKTAPAIGVPISIALPAWTVEAAPPHMFVPVRDVSMMLTEFAQCRVCGGIASIEQFVDGKIPGGHRRDFCPWA